MKKQKKYTIGIDIGGTNMRSILFDGEKIIADYSLGTPQDNLKHFLIMLNALIEPLNEYAQKNRIEISGIGLGIAGIMDSQTGKIIKCPNIPILDSINIIEAMKEITALPIKIDNDTNCFLRGEMIHGAGAGYKNTYGFIIGTGIGGAWWHNNEIYQGPHGSAGEPGRMIIDYKEKLELEKTYRQILNNDPLSTANSAIRGDSQANQAYEEFGNLFGIVCANIINILDPEAIIIGGGTTKSYDLFLGEARKSMKKFIMNPEAKKNVKIIKSKLDDQAGSIGAALLFDN